MLFQGSVNKQVQTMSENSWEKPTVKFTGCKFKSLNLQTLVLSFVKKVFIGNFLNSKKIRIKQLLAFTILILFLGIFSDIRGFSFLLITRTINCEGLLTNLITRILQVKSGNRKLLKDIPVSTFICMVISLLAGRLITIYLVHSLINSSIHYFVHQNILHNKD